MPKVCVKLRGFCTIPLKTFYHFNRKFPSRKAIILQYAFQIPSWLASSQWLICCGTIAAARHSALSSLKSFSLNHRVFISLFHHTRQCSIESIIPNKLPTPHVWSHQYTYVYLMSCLHKYPHRISSRLSSYNFVMCVYSLFASRTYNDKS